MCLWYVVRLYLTPPQKEMVVVRQVTVESMSTKENPETWQLHKSEKDIVSLDVSAQDFHLNSGDCLVVKLGAGEGVGEGNVPPLV